MENHLYHRIESSSVLRVGTNADVRPSIGPISQILQSIDEEVISGVKVGGLCCPLGPRVAFQRERDELRRSFYGITGNRGVNFG